MALSAGVLSSRGCERNTEAFLRAVGSSSEAACLEDNWVADGAFPEVPTAVLGHACGNDVASSRWRQREDIFMPEGRAGLLTDRRLARSVRNFVLRHLVLGDSVTAIFSIIKGRATH